MVAADFDNDGWPDLYVGVFSGLNRLFLNDGQGSFRDATTGEIDDEGHAYGIAIGDLDNDGDQDIFQAAGGSHRALFRSPLLQNLGEGLFLDITEGVGLSALDSEVVGAGLGDLDNDGDLDLLTGRPHFLFINTGDGEFVDRTDQSGIGRDAEQTISLGDYDLDGFLDVVYGAGESQGLYRNNGNANHWLRVELIGTQSNRNGIGARLVTTAGELRQMREILGGLGYYQDEMVAHFGLGSRTRVDTLEIRWPSGQVDVLTDIPADQKIRVFEGQKTYHIAHPTRWEPILTDSVLVGVPFELTATINGLRISINEGSLIGLTGGLVDIGMRDWQEVEIPFDDFALTSATRIESIVFSGNLEGTFYIDELRLATTASVPATAIVNAHTSSLPVSFALAQNYPNPFNASTVLRFSLPSDADITLSLYNLAGQQVATLVDDRRAAGTYTLRWDGRDDDGRELASGVYLYRLRTETQVETRKLLLVR